MKKADFVTLILSTVGGILFALGMCMCLLPEWDTFREGAVMGTIGVVVLIAMVFVRRKMLGKPPIKLNGKTIGTILLIIAGVMLLGAGLSMTMVWENMLVPGILVGIAGIVLLLFLIPLCKGLK